MFSVAEYARDSGFPSFSPLFERGQNGEPPPYLTLLNLYTQEEARLAVRTARHAVAQCPDAPQEVRALFADANWRPQLVGATAVLLGVDNADTIAALWQAFDGGTWVSPQLAATAYLADREFEVRARARIEARCPINRSRLEELEWPARHSAAGPGSFASHSGKALASLVALCRQAGRQLDWLDEALAQEATRETLRADFDRADQIAVDWLQNIRKVLQFA